MLTRNTLLIGIEPPALDRRCHPSLRLRSEEVFSDDDLPQMVVSMVLRLYIYNSSLRKMLFSEYFPYRKNITEMKEYASDTVYLFRGGVVNGRSI